MAGLPDQRDELPRELDLERLHLGQRPSDESFFARLSLLRLQVGQVVLWRRSTGSVLKSVMLWNTHTHRTPMLTFCCWDLRLVVAETCQLSLKTYTYI